MFSLLLGLAISMVVAVLGYSRARAFVSERLRYVDAVNHPLAPLMAGAGAFLVGALVAAFLRRRRHGAHVWLGGWPRSFRRPR
jgi:hypothetical protein